MSTTKPAPVSFQKRLGLTLLLIGFVAAVTWSIWSFATATYVVNGASLATLICLGLGAVLVSGRK